MDSSNYLILDSPKKWIALKISLKVQSEHLTIYPLRPSVWVDLTLKVMFGGSGAWCMSFAPAKNHLKARPLVKYSIILLMVLQVNCLNAIQVGFPIWFHRCSRKTDKSGQLYKPYFKISKWENNLLSWNLCIKNMRVFLIPN
jgi:hypothetical protein